MKNLIVAGDSFCSDPNGWPQMLADSLSLNLICYGGGGEHWWTAKQFIERLSNSDKDNCEVIVFVHTSADRLPIEDKELVKINIHDTNDKIEPELAVKLYYKYIHNSKFMEWAQTQWFLELSDRWNRIKLINLHSFPKTLTGHLPMGMNVKPCLAAVSLNEAGAKTSTALIEDSRSNHFSYKNNQVLATQLAQLAKNYVAGAATLTLKEFEQRTNQWLEWK